MQDETQATHSAGGRSAGSFTTTFAVRFDDSGRCLDIRPTAVLMRGLDRFLGGPWSRGDGGRVARLDGAKAPILDVSLDRRAREIGCLHSWRDDRDNTVEYAPANDDGDIRYIVRIRRADGGIERLAVDSGRYASLRLGSPELAAALLAAADADREDDGDHPAKPLDARAV